MPIIYNNGFPETWSSGKLNKEILDFLDNNDVNIIDGTCINAKVLRNLKIGSINSLNVVCNVDPYGFYNKDAWPRYINCSNIQLITNLTYPNWSFWGFYCYKNFINYKNKKFPLECKNRFLSYNRTPYNHRKDLVKSIIDNNFLSKGIVTLGKDVDKDNSLYLNIEENFDIKNENVGGDCGIPNDINSLGNMKVWNSCFLNIVSETIVNKFWVSEKTFKPIIGKRPFLHQNPFVIDKLKEWGFKTFENYWNPKDLIGTLKQICTMSDEEISYIYKDMSDDLEFNHNHFFNNYHKKNMQELATIKVNLLRENKSNG